jgi:hypothetical protein
MKTWPELQVDVIDDVDLDSRNIRLEMPVTAPQIDIMRDLFANGDAMPLLEGIVRVGYLTHEIPIVVVRDERVVVVEGNRRLAALKAIQNPYLVPEHQARIAALVQEFADRDTLKNIAVKKAPDQDQADQLIAAIHTSNTRIRWKPARQAAFFQAQVNAGRTLPELLQLYPMSDVRRYVRTSQLLNRFRNAQYVDPELADFFNTKKFKPTDLSRIYESAEFARVLGVEMRNDGSIRMSVSESRFNKIATLIIDGMKSGAYNARTLPTTKDPRFIALIAEIERLATPSVPKRSSTPEKPTPPKSAGTSQAGVSSSGSAGTSSSSTGATVNSSAAASQQTTSAGTGQQAAGSSSGAPSVTPPSSRRTASAHLDSHNLIIPPAFPVAIHQIFDELTTISVKKYPNATMDLLRTFLEKVIKAYARDNNLTIVPKHRYVQLGDCLSWLSSHVQTLPGHSGLSAMILKIQSRNPKQYATSAAYLNDINHNPDMYAMMQDTHDLWEAMVGLMQLMLK